MNKLYTIIYNFLKKKVEAEDAVKIC